MKYFEVTMTPPYLIVSEYCAGGSLCDLMHKLGGLQLAWSQRLKILCDVAAAMEYLHIRRPVVLHRNLRSCNVLLTKRIVSPNQEPVAKVSDFGFSRTPPNFENVTTQCASTWRWMAPELFRGCDYDEHVDTYAFGMLMFEVLSHSLPYADQIPESAPPNARIVQDIMNGHRPYMQLVHLGCPAKVMQMMQTCWGKEPSARPEFVHVRERLQSQSDLVSLYNELKQKDM
jgi:serine/threonine-protein kinase CTR1